MPLFGNKSEEEMNEEEAKLAAQQKVMERKARIAELQRQTRENKPQSKLNQVPSHVWDWLGRQGLR